MATKNLQNLQWFCITYDYNNQCLYTYIECTYKSFLKYLSKFERKYSNVTWHYCDNPYNSGLL